MAKKRKNERDAKLGCSASKDNQWGTPSLSLKESTIDKDSIIKHCHQQENMFSGFSHFPVVISCLHSLN